MLFCHDLPGALPLVRILRPCRALLFIIPFHRALPYVEMSRPFMALFYIPFRGLLPLHLPYHIDYCSIYPFNGCDDFIGECGFLGLSTNCFCLLFQLPNCFYWKTASLNFFQQIFPEWIDCNTTFGNDYINQLARPTYRCYLICDYRNTVAK